MLRLEKKIWDLDKYDFVFARPRELLCMRIEFPHSTDLSLQEFELTSEEHPWPVQPPSYHIANRKVWSWDSPIWNRNGRYLEINIPWEDIETWFDIRMRMQLNTRLVDTTDQWCIADFSITVARGE